MSEVQGAHDGYFGVPSIGEPGRAAKALQAGPRSHTTAAPITRSARTPLSAWKYVRPASVDYFTATGASRGRIATASCTTRRANAS